MRFAVIDTSAAASRVRTGRFAAWYVGGGSTIQLYQDGDLRGEIVVSGRKQPCRLYASVDNPDAPVGTRVEGSYDCPFDSGDLTFTRRR